MIFVVRVGLIVVLKRAQSPAKRTPQTTHKDAEGKTIYDDLFHPITAGARTALVGLISQEYDNALKQNQSAGVESVPTPAEESPVQKM